MFYEVLSLGYLEIKANNDEMAGTILIKHVRSYKKTCSIIKHSVLQLTEQDTNVREQTGFFNHLFFKQISF